MRSGSPSDQSAFRFRWLAGAVTSGLDLRARRPSPRFLLWLSARLRARARPPRGRAPDAAQRRRARQVRVVPAAEESLVRSIAVTGTLAAEEQVTLSMKVTGRLNELLVDLGSRVTQGQTLARLVPTDFNLRVNQSRAALLQARARLGLPPQRRR